MGVRIREYGHTVQPRNPSRPPGRRSTVVGNHIKTKSPFSSFHHRSGSIYHGRSYHSARGEDTLLGSLVALTVILGVGALSISMMGSGARGYGLGHSNAGLGFQSYDYGSTPLLSSPLEHCTTEWVCDTISTYSEYCRYVETCCDMHRFGNVF